MNDKCHGEIHATSQTSYSYIVSDLCPGDRCDVHVRAHSGSVSPRPDCHACLSESEPSNMLSLTPAAPPEAVAIRLAAIAADGLDLTWPFPQQYGDANVSGFQLIKNGKLCGALIPPETTMYKLTNLEIGETCDLQLISLTDHPVGKYSELNGYNPNYSTAEADSGEVRKVVHPDYPACRVGPVLTLKYTHLAKPVVKIWTEKVTGYSAMVAFKTSKMSHHFADAEYYLVRCWPGTEPDDDVQEIRTDSKFIC